MEGRTFLVGDDLTAADIMSGYSCKLAQMTGQIHPRFANVIRYLAGLETRPAFETAFAD